MDHEPRQWPLQEAKAKFSEVVRRARTEGPQTVTLHGEPVATVSAFDPAAVGDDGETGLAIVEAFRNCPIKDLDFPRDRSGAGHRDTGI